MKKSKKSKNDTSNAKLHVDIDGLATAKFSVGLKELQDKLRMIAEFIGSLSDMDSDPIVLIQAMRLKDGVRQLRLSCANEQMYARVDLPCLKVDVAGECAVPLHFLRSFRPKKGSVFHAAITDSTLKGVIENPGASQTAFDLDILVEVDTVRVMFPDGDTDQGFVLPKAAIMAGIFALNFTAPDDEGAVPIRIDFHKAKIEFSIYDSYRFGHTTVPVDPATKLPAGQFLVLDRMPISLVLNNVPDNETFRLHVGDTKYVIATKEFYVEFQKLGEFNINEEEEESGYDPRNGLEEILNIKKGGSKLQLNSRSFSEAIMDVSAISMQSLAAEARMMISLSKEGETTLSVNTEAGSMSQVLGDAKILSRRVKKITVNAKYLRELLNLSGGDEDIVYWSDSAIVIESGSTTLSCSLLEA